MGTSKMRKSYRPEYRREAARLVIDTERTIAAVPCEITACHQLYQAENCYRIPKSDLQARPVYAHQHDSIKAHLAIVFATLAIARWLETTTG